MPTLVANMSCQTCGKSFPFSPLAMLDRGLDQFPTHCPACNDRRQSAPVVRHGDECLREWGAVTIHSLPSGWVGCRLGELAGWRCDFSGSKYGASWEGRIVLHAPAQCFPAPPARGQVVSVRDMVSSVEVVTVTTYRATMHHGAVPVVTYLPATTRDEDFPRIAEEHAYCVTGYGQSPETRPAVVKRIVESRPHIVLGRPRGEDEGLRLLWLEAYSKTTLKGFGRQFHASLKLDGVAAVWSCSGGARSGRYGTEGALCIAAEGSPIGVEHRENGETTFASPW